MFFVFSLAASSNIGPVCLPNVGLNISDHQEGWITRFGGAVNGGETVRVVTEHICEYKTSEIKYEDLLLTYLKIKDTYIQYIYEHILK